MDHGGPPSWPVNHEQRHNGLPNGYPVVSPPNEQQYQPQQSASLAYAQPGSSYSSAQYLGPAGSYAGQAQVRRKQVRATQACNHCRSRKQKCDEARPCQFCRENNFDCQYKDVPPPKQDRTMMQLQDSVNNISDVLRTFVEGFESWKDSVERRLPAAATRTSMAPPSNQPSPDQSYTARGSFSEQSGSRMPTPVQPRAPLQRMNSMKTESPTVSHTAMSPAPAHASTPIKQEAMMAAPQPPATPAESVRTENESGGEQSKEKKGLMGDHTTPAHKLLTQWPSMASFAEDIPTIKRIIADRNDDDISAYPIYLEQKRGLIRVWGVGEGQDLNDGAQGPGSPESTHHESDAPSPIPVKEGLWGPRDAPSPSTIASDTYPEEDNVGGLGADGRPKLDEYTLKKLLASYHKHIHSLHPFLNPSRLSKMVHDFSEIYSPKPPGTFSPGSAVPPHVAGVKRKRSASAFADPYSPGRPVREGAGSDTIERSLRNCIVLLVLALGKVCEYDKPLPAPQSDRNTMTNNYGVTDSSPRSANTSFSGDDGNDTRPRNMDCMPGMAYFCYATDILGNQQGGNTVGHAQAMLLAALYLGQFARVLESWSWINNACRVCLILIKEQINRHVLFSNNRTQPDPPPKEAYRLNLIKCVYWTCLQLETDILAEMSTLPPSDISKYQEEVSYPSGVFEKMPESLNFDDDNNSEHEKTMWTYSSQIHLRVILNEAHNTLYGGNSKKNTGLDVNNLKEVANAARVHADILMSWRNLLPSQLAWDDYHLPSTDINIARLRAKFYGGHYMILRPFLFLAVHDIELPPGPPTSSAWNSQTSSPAGYSDSVATPNSGARPIMDLSTEQQNLLQVAIQCINSAIQSTIAFDRVGMAEDAPYTPYETITPKRLIVTNIFGTLHAQFGNMIVLAAVFTKSGLRNHLPSNCKLTKRTLESLFKRTIKVLEQVAPNSPILRVDVDILRRIQKLNHLQP
ncbi:hypothetical protein EJ04DRAFT_445911 [Polyplosphaeria fusca]|uniref:Zn(2)-C6 fungal-type domain-containing protein n=1 Tax=Polyplosphaeria fusca TaxID=682080 RepID=A0A9P4QP48_9PLEO|nr:hypothetical protein EJ04DRAFT_445911 [Polyplosphaeria fusca]